MPLNKQLFEGSEIIEEGSNANGDWVKFGNGTMICWLNTSTTSVSLNTSYGSLPLYIGNYTWTFPQAFIAPPSASCGMFKWGSSASWGNVNQPPTTTEVILRGYDSSSRASGTSTQILATAIGRWK